jgi:hypothetical protein
VPAERRVLSLDAFERVTNSACHCFSRPLCGVGAFPRPTTEPERGCQLLCDQVDFLPKALRTPEVGKALRLLEFLSRLFQTAPILVSRLCV